MAHLLLGSSRLLLQGIPAQTARAQRHSACLPSVIRVIELGTVYLDPGSTEPHPFANPVSPRLAQCPNPQINYHCTFI